MATAPALVLDIDEVGLLLRLLGADPDTYEFASDPWPDDCYVWAVLEPMQDVMQRHRARTDEAAGED